tara:strand:+ start:836 stop:1192 length:357 start_codon:yes stop_codon:yes gene_type:complete
MSTTEQIKLIVIEALEELKTKDIVKIDVSEKSNFTDLLIVGTGTSSTHIKSISDSVINNLKKKGHSKLIKGIEPNNDWILIDLFDIVINIMLSETREFYDLEKLWSLDSTQRSDSKLY